MAHLPHPRTTLSWRAGGTLQVRATYVRLKGHLACQEAGFTVGLHGECGKDERTYGGG